MKTQLDKLQDDRKTLSQLIKSMQKHGHTDTDLYKYLVTRLDTVLSTMENIR
jgi:hypothetical protein